MSDIYESAKPLSIRQSEEGNWEIENAPGNWITCHTEEDARIISNAPVVLEKSWRVEIPDEALAAELEEVSKKLQDYRIGFGARFLQHRAEVIRGKHPKN